MKISKNLNYILMGLSVLVLVLSYLFVFTKLQEKSEVLETENVALQADVNVLLDLQAKHEERQELKKQYELEILEIVDRYPEKIKQEDLIMYVDSLEMNNKFVVEAMELPSSEKVNYTQLDENGNAISTETVDVASVSENAIGNYGLSSSGTNVAFASTYQSIKDVIKYILDDLNQKSIETVSLNYDEATGNIKGSMLFKSYALTGSGKEYVAPTVSGVAVGTTNMFHSVEDLNAKRDAEVVAETETEGATDTATDTETE